MIGTSQISRWDVQPTTTPQCPVVKQVYIDGPGMALESRITRDTANGSTDYPRRSPHLTQIRGHAHCPPSRMVLVLVADSQRHWSLDFPVPLVQISSLTLPQKVVSYFISDKEKEAFPKRNWKVRWIFFRDGWCQVSHLFAKHMPVLFLKIRYSFWVRISRFLVRYLRCALGHILLQSRRRTEITRRTFRKFLWRAEMRFCGSFGKK